MGVRGKSKKKKKRRTEIQKKRGKTRTRKGVARRLSPELTLPALASYGVDLVDKHDARSVLASLLEQVADAPGADTDEHLDEVRTWKRRRFHEVRPHLGEEAVTKRFDPCCGFRIVSESLGGHRRGNGRDVGPKNCCAVLMLSTECLCSRAHGWAATSSTGE